MGEPWSSAEQVAAQLEAVQDPICRWVEAQGLPAHKVGQLWKFKHFEVNEWVRAGEAESSKKSTSKIKKARS